MVAAIRRFRDRADAGRQLAERLQSYAGRPDTIVVGLPRGGMPVAAEIARCLALPLDFCLVSKLTSTGHHPATIGAIDSGGDRILNYDVLSRLSLPDKTVDKIIDRQLRELHRKERVYREHRAPLDLRNRSLILVDDGLATGATLRSAIALLRQQSPRSLTVALPTAPKTACDRLQADIDELVCLTHPDPFFSIALSYENYAPVSDEEVRQILSQSNSEANPFGQSP